MFVRDLLVKYLPKSKKHPLLEVLHHRSRLKMSSSADSSPFPTKYELKWAGWSLVVSTLLWVLVGIIFAIISPEVQDASVYDVRTEEDIVELHDMMSASSTRLYIEMIAAIYWLTFPLLLTAIYGIRKLYLSIFIGTKMELWIYVMERGYLLSLV